MLRVTQMQTIRIWKMRLQVGCCRINSQQSHGLDSHNCRKIALSLASRVPHATSQNDVDDSDINHKFLSKSNSTRLWLTREQEIDWCAQQPISSASFGAKGKCSQLDNALPPQHFTKIAHICLALFCSLNFVSREKRISVFFPNVLFLFICLFICLFLFYFHF